MNPSEIGERAEISVIAALIGAGVQVVTPFGAYHRYDLAFEYQDQLVKVQWKTGREKSGFIGFYTCNSTRSGERRDYRGDLRLTPPRNKQKAGIRMADQYLVRDGRLPDAVVQRFNPAGSTPDRTRDSRPSRLTSS